MSGGDQPALGVEIHIPSQAGQHGSVCFLFLTSLEKQQNAAGRTAGNGCDSRFVHGANAIQQTTGNAIAEMRMGEGTVRPLESEQERFMDRAEGIRGLVGTAGEDFVAAGAEGYRANPAKLCVLSFVGRIQRTAVEGSDE